MPEGSLSYGLDNKQASYYLTNIFHSAGGYEGDLKHNEEIILHFAHEVVSKTQLYSAIAAIIAGDQLGLKHTQILAGISSITPVSGRLRRLRGINGSLIIDDTYNASPEAVKAGLENLYELDFTNKIAILGNMNELGSISEQAHKEIGEMCDPKQLSLVLTLGPDANKFIASSAEAKGCQVKKFDTPYQLGEYLQTKIEPDTVIFAKGSQNKVFAEESVKMILADPEDTNKLVRQSDYWLKLKKKNFGVK
jgi:UDP-N-acetylmuramyl pentapeptide synthase